MAVENGGEFRGSGVEVESAEVVEQVNIVALEEQDVGFRQAAAGAGAIDVAAHRVNRGDLGEGFEDGWIADIAEVKDVLDACQSG